jgi:hypothetical protein
MLHPRGTRSDKILLRKVVRHQSLGRDSSRRNFNRWRPYSSAFRGRLSVIVAVFVRITRSLSRRSLSRLDRQRPNPPQHRSEQAPYEAYEMTLRQLHASVLLATAPVPNASGGVQNEEIDRGSVAQPKMQIVLDC